MSAELADSPLEGDEAGGAHSQQVERIVNRRTTESLGELCGRVHSGRIGI